MNTQKLFQVVAYVLQHNDREMDYYNLIKECYIADRRSIEKKGYAITGDEYICMYRGPVLKGVYSFIKNKNSDINSQQLWNSYFSVDENHKISVKKDFTNYDYLSKFDEKILFEVCSEFYGYTYKQMKAYAHKDGVFPEWIPVLKDQEESLPLEKIMAAVGIPQTEIYCLITEQKSFEKEASLFTLN